MDKNIPDWRSQPKEYREYLEERIPMVLIESAQRNFAQEGSK